MAEKKVKESKVKGNSFGASGFTFGILSIISFGIIGIIMSISWIYILFYSTKEKTNKIRKSRINY